MSSGRYPFNETGMLINKSSTALKAQYHSTNDSYVETKEPFTSIDWTRVTFRLKKNDDAIIYLNNVEVDQDKYKHGRSAAYKSNSAKVINLASMSSWGNVSSSQMWAVENIQLSDLSLWIGSIGEAFAERKLRAMLGTAFFKIFLKVLVSDTYL